MLQGNILDLDWALALSCLLFSFFFHFFLIFS